MIIMRHFKICLLAVFILLTCKVVVLSQHTAPSARDIISNMAVRYASLLSYEDTGVVETITVGPLAKRSTDISFKTYFTRPKKLRFEWLDHFMLAKPERNVIWSDGVKAFSSYAFEDGKIETQETIGMMIAGATGISRASADTVPDLLMPDEIAGFSLTDLTKLSLKGQEIFEGADCYVVEGYHPNGEPWQLWIRKDFLLIKLRTVSTDDQLKEEIRRNIKVDGKISEALYQPKLAGARLAYDVAKEKEADIRRLLEIVVPRERINQELSDLIELVKKIVPQAPQKTIHEVIAELRFDSEMVQQVYIPIYDWHYTSEEIKQLLAFYESPLGQKMGRSSHLIESQAMRRGIGIGEELMKRIQERLRAKGYKVTAE